MLLWSELPAGVGGKDTINNRDKSFAYEGSMPPPINMCQTAALKNKVLARAELGYNRATITLKYTHNVELIALFGDLVGKAAAFSYMGGICLGQLIDAKQCWLASHLRS